MAPILPPDDASWTEAAMGRCVHLLLCHDAAADLRDKIAAYREAGDRVAVHVDARAAPVLRALRDAFGRDDGVAFAPSRRCGWGEWSLVAASLDLLRLGLARFADATHFALQSADCYPTVPAAVFRAALAPSDRDWVEAQDYFRSGWIKTGLREERLIYRHYVNERAHPKLFYAMVRAQRRLGLARPLPRDLPMRIGSQWVLLRRATAEGMLDLFDARPDLGRFFRRVWIPDECCLQTLAAAVAPGAELTGAPPTRLAFSDYGQPVVFHAAHEGLLRGRDDRFFARKIARGDGAFRRRLLSVWRGVGEPAWAPAALGAPARGALVGAGAGAEAPPSPPPRVVEPPQGPDPVEVYRKLRLRGRAGARSGPRPWERHGALGPGRDAVAVICKKWHLAAEGAEAVGAALGLPAFGPLFDDAAPAQALGRDGAARDAGAGLGGLDAGMEKRRRRPGLLLAAIAEAAGSEGAVFALDPARAAVLGALAADGARLTAIELQAPCSDDYLLGHAARIGLWSGPPPPPPLREELLRTLRAELEGESRALAGLGLPRLARAAPGRAGRLAPELGAALHLPEARAQALAEALCGLV
ncbi:DUF5928 domain-containing protein [Rhodovulum sp. DZ06]|uniref:DUF5928 domain-containing protein n=1 Tax=Rhodovulum sp. DZ06 TaxID=3425126 RepID=UPI003D3315DC